MVVLKYTVAPLAATAIVKRPPITLGDFQFTDLKFSDFQFRDLQFRDLQLKDFPFSSPEENFLRFSARKSMILPILLTKLNSFFILAPFLDIQTKVQAHYSILGGAVKDNCPRKPKLLALLVLWYTKNSLM